MYAKNGNNRGTTAISSISQTPKAIAFLDDLLHEGNRRRLVQMRLRYTQKENDEDQPYREFTLLDRVRDSGGYIPSKQRWLRSRLHWFGDTEEKRLELERELQRILIESKKETVEIRKPAAGRLPVYDMSSDYTSEFHQSQSSGEEQAASHALAAVDVAVNYGSYLEQTSAAYGGPQSNFDPPDVMLSQSMASAGEIQSSAGQSPSVADQSGIAVLPETAMLFEHYYPQPGQHTRKNTSSIDTTSELLKDAVRKLRQNLMSQSAAEEGSARADSIEPGEDKKLLPAVCNNEQITQPESAPYTDPTAIHV